MSHAFQCGIQQNFIDYVCQQLKQKNFSTTKWKSERTCVMRGDALDAIKKGAGVARNDDRRGRLLKSKW